MSVTGNKVSKRAGRSMTQAERTALSNIRMLDAAINHIVEQGVEEMTLKGIGEAAGYSRGLAGHRFGTKKDLIAYVIHAIGDKWLQELKAVTEDKVGLDAICAAIDAHYRFCQNAPNHVLAFYILWFESINPGSLCKDIMAGIHERRKKDIARWVLKGIENSTIDPSVKPDMIAEQLCSAIIGIVYHWLNKPDSMGEIRRLHDGLKQVMSTLLTPKYQGLDKNTRS